jgi:predicted nucleotidyltransferase component of viral defense system
MDKFLKLSATDRKDILTESSKRLGINAQVLEKDFFVCWIMDNLFSNQEFYENMIFKGGTSLSKSYKLIERFSEDCDLTINRQILDI